MNYLDPDVRPEASSRGSPGIAEDVCAALCRVLGDGVDVHRCLAARALGRIGHPAAAEPLIAAMLDEDSDVRTDAAAALGRMADPRAGRQLLENLLGDPCGEVKMAAIEALVRIREREAIPWLRCLVRGRDEDIVWDEDEFFENGWDDWVDIQAKAVQALADFGAGEAVPDIVAAIEDEHGQDITETGFKALARLGGPGLDALAGFLDDDDERRRRRAAAVLAGADNEAAGGAVLRALGDPSVQVRLAAARALAARDPSDARLVPLFGDGAPEVRAEAARLCGSRHADRIGTLLDDPAPTVARAALDVLAEAPGLLPGEAVTGKVRGKLEGPHPEVMAAAASALAALAPGTAADNLARLLADISRPPEARVAALRGLAAIGGATAVDALIGVVGNEQRQLRLEALTALTALTAADRGWPNATGDALLAALRGELVDEPEPAPGDDTKASGPSAAAPEAARSPGEPKREGEAGNEQDEQAAAAFPKSTLQSILGDNAVAAELVESRDQGIELTQEDMERLALAQRSPRARRVALASKVAPHQDVRRFAARVLGDLPRREVARELAKALDDDDREVRIAAADSLARIGGRAGPLLDETRDALLGALGSTSRDMRLCAVRALAAADDGGADKTLIGCLHDDDGFVRAEAVRALSGHVAARREIAALLDDPEPGVRLAAAEAVTEGGGSDALALLVDFAFAFEGTHRREAGRLLRALDAAAASARFLEALGDTARRRTWQVAIEALEELNRGAGEPGDQSDDHDETRSEEG